MGNFEKLSNIQKFFATKKQSVILDWWDTRPCLQCQYATKRSEPNPKKKECKECKKKPLEREFKLTHEEIVEMVKGIVTFCKHHHWDWRFGDKKERYMKPGNFGILELRLQCGCAVIFGYMDNGTYHLHSMELREEGFKEELFVV